MPQLRLTAPALLVVALCAWLRRARRSRTQIARSIVPRRNVESKDGLDSSRRMVR